MQVKPSSSTLCGHCGTEERRLLHHVRHRGSFRRLCTSCVLRLHPQSFCPTCFQLYPPSPSNDAVFNCSKCYSNSHSHCVTSSGISPFPSPYICPLCVTPNIPIFKLRTAKEAGIDTGGDQENWKVMEKSDAKKLVVAAKIASASMNKAAASARLEAEKRAKEAAYTRKRAKEALEHVAYLMGKEKLLNKKKKEEEEEMVVVGVKVESGNTNVVVSNQGVLVEALNAVELKEKVGEVEEDGDDEELGMGMDEFCKVMDTDDDGLEGFVDEINNEVGSGGEEGFVDVKDEEEDEKEYVNVDAGPSANNGSNPQ